MMSKENWNINHQLHHFESIGLQRELRVMGNATHTILTYQDKEMLNLASSNYLGLANHPQLIEAMTNALENGTGSTSSRLVVGHNESMKNLEEELATYKKTESCLLFANGYMANIGLLSSLLHSDDAVFSDRLNHASIIDGIRLSGAHHYRYRHQDLNQLENLLKKANNKSIKKKMIVTETVFSMDGDIASLKEIIFLKEKYGAILMIDDAHGEGIFGPQGRGVAHHLELAAQIDLHMGTFSKAYGVYGAYIAGRKEWIQYLIHTCRSFIYTTALPPSIIKGIHKALKLVKEGDHLRLALLEKSKYFRQRLHECGGNIGKSVTQIIPLIIGQEKIALQFSQKLMENSILCLAIRPPTVPPKTSRLRFTILANHKKNHLNKALDIIAKVDKELGVMQ